MSKKEKEFNIIINGVGGQGLITLLKIIAEATFIEGKDIKTSELHGLSQRGGSVEVHIRIGEKIWSPLVSKNSANLILSLEKQESLNGLYYANKSSIFLINDYQTPTLLKDFLENEILDRLHKFSKNVYLVSASETCQKELGTEVVSGIYLLGCAISKESLPINSDSIILAIKKIIPEKYLELNIKAFELGKEYGK